MIENIPFDDSECPELFTIFPILKRDRSRNFTLSLGLEKSLYKKTNTLKDRLIAKMLKLVPFVSKKVFKAQTNELNMFLITYSKFDPFKILELQDRIEIENSLTRSYSKYMKKIIQISQQ